MTAWVKGSSVAALLLALAGPAAAAGKLPAACTPGKAALAGVASVIDGATIALADGRVIALAGMEAPLQSAGHPSPATPVAAASTRALATAAGSAVRVVPVDEKPDRYGRQRANVFAADGASLAAVQVAAGFGRVHRLPGDPACVLSLLDVERSARIDGRGLWGDPDYRIRSATDPSLAAQTGLYGLVAGRVVSIGRGDVVTFVNFGRDYDRDFTVMLTPAVAKGLGAAGVDVDALPGRRVLVRGMIESDGGPLIRLSDATDIELLEDGGD